MWYGDYVDFGDFGTTISKNHKPNDEIELCFCFQIYNSRYLFFNRKKGDLASINVKLSMKINDTNISEYKITFVDQSILMKVSKDGFLQLIINDEEVKTNGKLIARRLSGDIVPLIVKEVDNKRHRFGFYSDLDDLQEKVNLELFDDSKNEHFLPFDFDMNLSDIISKESMLKFINRLNKRKFAKYKVNDEKFTKINNIVLECYLMTIIEALNDSFKNEFYSLNYMKPIRAAVNRYYRVQGISVDEVDSDGSNLPMLLKNMTESQLRKFESWSKEKFGAVFSIDAKVAGHLSLVIRDDVGSDIFTNVADAGYGYSQMLPIVVLLWNIHNNTYSNTKDFQNTIRTIIIEQPELHLHPAFQARMLDVFVNIINECKKNKIELKIIFETHSETMINRIGTLICDGVFPEDDVNILVFEKQETGTKIIKTNFDSEGMLKNWPIDFFGIED